ncbi:MAG: hypothetical protein CM15mP120_13750 [Pseudomonadota bacterium]|nr:MAG: hypothetical protein CM15mP120_13750 [Pseudomonadota bacterium]
MELADKIVVVTGGASGIGREMCRRFVREGAKQVVVADRDGDGAERSPQRSGCCHGGRRARRGTDCQFD